jgi:hypothetical protein
VHEKILQFLIEGAKTSRVQTRINLLPLETSSDYTIFCLSKLEVTIPKCVSICLGITEFTVSSTLQSSRNESVYGLVIHKRGFES